MQQSLNAKILIPSLHINKTSKSQITINFVRYDKGLKTNMIDVKIRNLRKLINVANLSKITREPY